MVHIPPQLHQTGPVKTGMGTKQKRENRGSLIDFKFMDAQVRHTTQETEIDRHEKDLVNGMDNLMLDTDKTAPMDTLATKL